MRKSVTGAIILSFATVISLILISIIGCERSDMNPAEELEPVEIREYEGEKLSSIDDFRENSIIGPQYIDIADDFRENSIIGPQYIDIADYKLQVTGLVENPKSYTYDEVIEENKHYKKVVTLNCVEGWSVNILWEGILVKDLINSSITLPDAKVVIFHAYDGYTTSLPLEHITNNNIMMAYRMNEVDLPPERGFPFQLVAESKWGYKWVKWITEIELSDDVNYRGYWESRGYANDADLDDSFLES